MIPVYQPDLSGKEKEYVMDCMDSTWISSKGKYVERFENLFAEYIGVKYGTAVSNGTVAIHLALLTLEIGIGDEVIVPSFTYIASANPIVYVGAKPIFVDSSEDTWQINELEIEKKITDKTKAVIAPHLYGYPCKMDVLRKICDKHNIYLIEDCAEAIGSEYKGKKIGTYGDLACFSFFGNKTITTGEGGMVLSNNKELIDKARHIKDQGMSKTREYWHDIVGYNFRMTNICAAIGCAQLERIEQFVSRKIEVGALYKEMLKSVPVKFQKDSKDILNTYWMVAILLEDENQRRDFRKYLKEHDIDTRPTFSPIHKMPMYDLGEYYPVSEDLGKRGINLPSYPLLSNEQIEYICNVIKDFFAK